MRRSGVVVVMALLAACGRATADIATPMAVGDPVRAYDAATLRGDTVRVGGVEPLTLVNVWATWCTSCREEMADLEALHTEFAPRGLRVVAVSIDAGAPARVQRFVDRERLTFTVAHDPEARIQKVYGVVGVPSSYLVGTDGRLLWQQVGGIHGAVKAVRAEVERYARK
ncbi:MAG: alkyl hydroperoxide reductase/Thiol specific antioxidant/Mal allergen [Gemmatimonadetes bacterium]|nr:alkyl hydroperoxide reductase/Thiol specific antioxidant/Mal allergen [Gemmatimonadota bacterium]